VRAAILRRSRSALGWGFLLLLAAGCGDKGYDRFIPSDSSARKALETALGAWQNGQRPGRIGSGPPAIEVIDAKWKAGQRLGAYQILKEEAGKGPKWFSVRLTLQQPSGEQVVRYVVLGQDPIWVYREDDFKRLSGSGM